MSSRLERIRSKKAGKQGMWYLILAIVMGIAMLFWGLPALARLAGNLIMPDPSTLNTYELKPTPPIISDVPEATNSASVTVSGFAQPGIDVALYVGGAELARKLTSESGVFSFSNVPVTDGANSIYAYAFTPGGLQSEQSKEYTITVDTKEPEITLDSPKDGEIKRGSTERIVSFSGKVDEGGAKVYIGERMAILSAEGSFNLPYQLVEGDQELLVKAIDKAGNTKEIKVKLRWEP